MKIELIKEIALTFELCGGVKLSNAAANLVIEGLSGYTDDQIRKSLARCRSECRSRLTPADIEQRIDDGRPLPDAAYAMCPTDGSQSVCWTEEMSHAYGIALPLIGDSVAHRMAFLAAYKSSVADAKAQRLPVKWELSLGYLVKGREDCIMAALRETKISKKKALMLIPDIEHKLLASPKPVDQLVEKLTDKMSM